MSPWSPGPGRHPASPASGPPPSATLRSSSRCRQQPPCLVTVSPVRHRALGELWAQRSGGPRCCVEGPSARVLTGRCREQGASALLRVSHSRPKSSNSPIRAPPTNACHSSGVKRSTAPSGSLLLRTPTSPPGRFATSTQLPLAKLRELLTQLASELSLSGRPPNAGVSTSIPR